MHPLYQKLLDIRAAEETGDYEYENIYDEDTGELLVNEEEFVNDMLSNLDPNAPEGELSQRQIAQIERTWKKSQGEELDDEDFQF